VIEQNDGGRRQRVFIALALVNDSEFVFAPLLTVLLGRHSAAESDVRGCPGHCPVCSLTHAIGLMGGVWLGISWVGYPKEIAVLAAQCMVGVAVAVRIFRWE